MDRDEVGPACKAGWVIQDARYSQLSVFRTYWKGAFYEKFF